MASVTPDPRNGNLVLRAYAGKDPETGRPRQVRDVLPAGASDARVAAACARLDGRAALMRETGAGRELTLDDLVRWYLDELDGANRAPGTVKSYRSRYFRHISPRRGSTAADAVMPFMLSRDLAAAVRGEEREAVSPATANGIRALLHAAYSAGVAEGVVARNPVAAVPKMTVDDDEDVRVFTARELPVLVAWLEEPAASWDELCVKAAASVALDTGMRVGEVDALRPCDRLPGRVRVGGSVTESGGLHRKSTKGRRKRTVSIDAATDGRMAAHEAAARELHGIGDHGWLFCDARGRIRAPSTISRAFSRACFDLGLGKGRRFHELRHTHATWLLERGTPLKVVSERLGHASEAFTLRLYAHVLPGRDAQAAEDFAELRLSAGGGRRWGM